MNDARSIMFYMLILSTFSAAAVSSLRAANSDWNNLKVLKAGQKIRIVLIGERRYEGLFRALNDAGITLGQSAGEQTFARKDILRVYFKDNSHRLRNTLIGAAIGATLAAIGVSANHVGENIGLRSTAWEWPVGMGAFGAIGAAMPTGRWLLVYHARRHRGSANSGH